MSKYSENMPPDIQTAIGWFYDGVKPKSRFLDFGCSTGYFGEYIKNTKGCLVDGVEISDDRKDAAKVLNKVYSFDLDAEWPAELLKNKYDYLFFGDVLEHLKDPQLVLERSRELLASSGSKIFISIPNVAHLSTRLELLQGSFEYEPMGILDNTHLKYFTLRTFTEIITHAGYKVVHFDYTANDYPDEVVTEVLAKVGLTPSDKFWKLAKQKEARAYQYKFVLQPASPTKVKRVEKHLPDAIEKPEQFKLGYISDLKGQIEALRKHAEEQAAIIAHQKRELDRRK